MIRERVFCRYIICKHCNRALRGMGYMKRNKKSVSFVIACSGCHKNAIVTFSNERRS